MVGSQVEGIPTEARFNNKSSGSETEYDSSLTRPAAPWAFCSNNATNPYNRLEIRISPLNAPQPCFHPQDAEAAVLVVKGDALDDTGDFLGDSAALWDRGDHAWGFIFPRTGLRFV
jgi:hypothetical protein